MFCRNCGSKLDDGDLFCIECGSKVVPLPKTESIEKNRAAFKGLLFDDYEPSFRNAVKATDLKKPEQAAADKEDSVIAPAFAESVLSVGQEAASVSSVQIETEPSEKPPVPDLSAVKSPLFSDDDLLPDKSVSKDETAVTSEETKTEENDNADLTLNEAVVGVSERVAAEESAPVIKQDAFDEDKTVFIQEPDDPDKTVFLPRDDSYNVYSGIIPGVNSQEFTYSTTENNTYQEKPVRVAPRFDDVSAEVDYNRPAYDERRYAPQEPLYYGDRAQDTKTFARVPRSAPVPPQPRNAYDYSNYGDGYHQQRGYEAPQKEGKKSNATLWVVIACIAVIIISLGAVGIVFISQLDDAVFADYISSFSNSKKEENDDSDTGETGENKDKTQADSESHKIPAVGAVKLMPVYQTGLENSDSEQLIFEYDESSGNFCLV